MERSLQKCHTPQNEVKKIVHHASWMNAHGHALLLSLIEKFTLSAFQRCFFLIFVIVVTNAARNAFSERFPGPGRSQVNLVKPPKP